MNAAELRGGSRAVDSLLNYEAVALFGGEQREVQRFDECLRSEFLNP